MKFLNFSLLILVLFMSVPSDAKFYGQDFVMPRGGEYKLEQVFEALKSDKDKKLENVVVHGEISSVCQKKGCWVSLKKTGDTEKINSCSESAVSSKAQKEMRVMFAGHSFEVPKDLSGEVLVQGTVKKKKLSKYQVKHFLKDLGCSESQIQSIKAPVYKYQMEATGLKIYGV